MILRSHAKCYVLGVLLRSDTTFNSISRLTAYRYVAPYGECKVFICVESSAPGLNEFRLLRHIWGLKDKLYTSPISGLLVAIQNKINQLSMKAKTIEYKHIMDDNAGGYYDW